jgi:hypothetical protein
MGEAKSTPIWNYGEIIVLYLLTFTFLDRGLT